MTKQLILNFSVLLGLLMGTSAFAEAKAPLTWWNADNESKIWLEERFMAKLQYPKLPNASPLVTLVAVKNGNHRRQLLKDHQLVFRNAESGGQKMVATGNVLVRFSPERDEAQAAAWAKEHETKVVEKILFEPSTYFFATAPGLTSIEKANEWKKLPGVKGAEPNWWRELELR